MVRKVKNLDELNGLLQPLIIEAMNMTGNFIYDKLFDKINQYYDEYDPVEYDRTYTLLNESHSLQEAKIIGNVIEMKVGFDDDYLTFRYKDATGLSVLKSMNEGYHGWKVYIGHHYWNELLDELGQEEGIIKLFKQNLKKCGVPVK